MTTDERLPRPASRSPLLGLILLCAGLMFAGIWLWLEVVPAPVEEPADPMRTPNPPFEVAWYDRAWPWVHNYAIPVAAFAGFMTGLFLLIRCRRPS